jgi:hypothetical protein
MQKALILKMYLMKEGFDFSLYPLSSFSKSTRPGAGIGTFSGKWA